MAIRFDASPPTAKIAKWCLKITAATNLETPVLNVTNVNLRTLI